jgi:hypothetical protein
MPLPTKLALPPRLLLLCILTLAELTGCGGESGSSPREPLGQRHEALSLTTVSDYTNTASTVLTNVNGRKTVEAINGLHTVWARGGTIYYSTSVDGITWSAPQVVDATTAAMPAISAASDGTVGIVYVRNTSTLGIGSIYYKSRSPSGVWTAAFRVTADTWSQNGTSPSLAIHHNDVHVTWAFGSTAKYTSFPLTQTAASGTAVLVGPGGPICSDTLVLYPSIAVSDGVSGAPPVVRIAFFQQQLPNGPSCNQATYFGVFVAQKPSNNALWSIVYNEFGEVFSGMEAVSLSLAANPTTGDFYLATSVYVNSTPSTRLQHENAHLTGDTWTSTLIAPARAQINVVAKTRACDNLFRIAFSTQPAWSDEHGVTSYRTGTWTGSAAAPTWLTPATQLHALGRAGSALLWTKQVGLSTMREVYALFETWEGSGSSQYSLVDAYETKPLTSCPGTPGPK